MINKDSIVTAYDEHLTLVEWLQKVENALNSAVLTNLGIAKLSDKDNVAIYQVTATFADNTSIASDSFTLPSTDIVTAFGNLRTLVNGFDTRIATNRENVNSILDIIDIAAEKIKADTLKNSINGDDDVIVEIDNDEDNEKLGIHLSPELQEKLARVLLKPSSAPTTRKVVTIDTKGAQDNVDPTELPALMSNIVDSQGNKRFQEWDISDLNTGLDITYAKVTLSGSHLMAVVSGINNTENEITLPLIPFKAILPTWLLLKLYSPSGNHTVERDVSAHELKMFSSLWENVTSHLVVVHITPTSNSFEIRTKGYISVPANSYIRLQVDLIID